MVADAEAKYGGAAATALDVGVRRAAVAVDGQPQQLTHIRVSLLGIFGLLPADRQLPDPNYPHRLAKAQSFVVQKG